MPTYESNRITRNGRKYYFSCYYTDKFGTRKKYMSKMYKDIRECEKATKHINNEIDEYAEDFYDDKNIKKKTMALNFKLSSLN